MSDVKKLEPIGFGGFSAFVKIAIIVIIVCLIIYSVALYMRYNELKAERERLEAEIKENNEKIGELRYLIDAPMDKNYVVKFAKENFGLVLPESIIYYNNLPK